MNDYCLFFFFSSQKLMSGTTALCALYRPTERLLVVGWVGDSKALLVSQNRVLQIVLPHKPDSEVNQHNFAFSLNRIHFWFNH